MLVNCDGKVLLLSGLPPSERFEVEVAGGWFNVGSDAAGRVSLLLDVDASKAGEPVVRRCLGGYETVQAEELQEADGAPTLVKVKREVERRGKPIERKG